MDPQIKPQQVVWVMYSPQPSPKQPITEESVGVMEALTHGLTNQALVDGVGHVSQPLPKQPITEESVGVVEALAHGSTYSLCLLQAQIQDFHSEGTWLQKPTFMDPLIASVSYRILSGPDPWAGISIGKGLGLYLTTQCFLQVCDMMWGGRAQQKCVKLFPRGWKGAGCFPSSPLSLPNRN